MHTLCKGLTSVREIPNTVIVRNVQYKRTTRSPQLQINYTPRKQEHIVTVCNSKGTLVSTMLERFDSKGATMMKFHWGKCQGFGQVN